jgi:hypothetical protein
MKIESELLDLGILNENLKSTQNINVSMALRREEVGLIGEDKFNSLLFQEASQALNKKILDEMSQSSEEFLDVMNMSEADSINHLHHYLMNNGYDWIIFNGQIGMFAQESLLFTNSPIGETQQKVPLRNSSFYHLGKLGNIDCYVNAYKRWDDKEIICGKKDSFNYNYSIGEIKENNQATFAPRLLLDLNYDFIIDKNNFINLHYVNEYNPKYVQVNRDRKLDELL